MSIGTKLFAILFMFLGTWGSFDNDFFFLIYFSVSMFLAAVTEACRETTANGSNAMLIVSILALAQAQLIDNGYSG